MLLCIQEDFTPHTNIKAKPNKSTIKTSGGMPFFRIHVPTKSMSCMTAMHIMHFICTGAWHREGPFFSTSRTKFIVLLALSMSGGFHSEARSSACLAGQIHSQNMPQWGASSKRSSLKHLKPSYKKRALRKIPTSQSAQYISIILNIAY